MSPQEKRRLLLRMHYFYALALGIISLRYDYRKRCFIPAPLLKVYAICMNVLMVGVVPLAILGSMSVLDIFGSNKLMRLTHHVNTWVRAIVVTLTLLYRLRRESQSKEIVEQLIAIETDYFDAVAVPRRLQCRFERLFYVKYFNDLFQTIGVIFVISQMTNHKSAWWLLFYLYFHSAMNLLLFVMFHYFMGLWHICKRFCILNVQLKRIFRVLKQLEGKDQRAQLRLAAEIHTIAILHYRLTQLVLQLNDIYKWQIVGVKLMQIITFTSFGYYEVMMAAGAGGTNFELTYSRILFGIGMYAAMLLELFVTDLMCDATIVAYQQTRHLLRRYHELDLNQIALVQSCHLLSQHLTQHKLRIRICGMFELNKYTSFIVLGEIIQKIIILLQFDIENRFG